MGVARVDVWLHMDTYTMVVNVNMARMRGCELPCGHIEQRVPTGLDVSVGVRNDQDVGGSPGRIDEHAAVIKSQNCLVVVIVWQECVRVNVFCRLTVADSEGRL